MRKLLFFVFFFIFLLFPRQVFADEGWVIENFHADIAIEKEGTVYIHESIAVDFNDLQKHGIFRDIPYVYDSNREKYYTEIEEIGVSQDNGPAKFEFTREDNYVRFKIGDPNKTISGKHSYIIQYRVKGILKGFSDYDELYWNVTGNAWGVPIIKASTRVTLPQEGILKLTCFQGTSRSTNSCSSKDQNGTAAEFTSVGLEPYTGLTIAVAYEKGLVPILRVERPKTFWEKFIDPLSLTTLFTSLLFGIGTIIYIWFKYGRDYWFANAFSASKTEEGKVKPIGSQETIVVEFEPPDKLRPAELGVLVDERAHTHDVTATIIDFATRGYLTITEVPKKWLFGKTDYKLTHKYKDKTGLLEYEKYLLEQLFDAGSEVTVSALKLTFYEELKKVKEKLYDDVVAKKLFPTDPDKVRTKYLAIGLISLGVGFFSIVYLGSADAVFLMDIAIGLMVSGLVMGIFSQFMPRRTAYGRELYRRTKGYYMFLSRAEKYRQQFFEKKNLFNEVLPYVIVFGLTDKFAKAMAEIGIKPQNTAWYHGTGAFNTASFGNSMSAFSSSVGSAIASAPNSGGGFSGGSSGGGFGGGGGGSW